jgi:hypothetical protein
VQEYLRTSPKDEENKLPDPISPLSPNSRGKIPSFKKRE